MESLREYLEGTFQQEQVDQDDLTNEILTVILILYLLGSGYEDESELTGEDREKLEEVYQLTISVVPGMIDRYNRGVDMQPTIERVLNHVYGIFFYAFAAHGMNATDMYRWDLGPTEHCTDCLEQAEMGAMPGSYWEEVALSGIYPRSPLLACTGLHCQCEITEA